MAFFWSDAAFAFMGVRGDLVERLQMKAEFWTNPASWTRQQVKDAGISINGMAALLKQFLVEGR